MNLDQIRHQELTGFPGQPDPLALHQSHADVFLASAGALRLGSMAYAGLSSQSATRDCWPPAAAPSPRRRSGSSTCAWPAAPGRARTCSISKPELAKLQGKPLPPSVIGGQRYAFIRSDAAVLGPQFKFAKYGKCGAELSEMLPHLSKIVDDITIVKSVKTDQFNHAPAQIFFNTGFGQPGRPSAWLVAALRPRCRDRKTCRAFVGRLSTGSGISGGSANWSSGFLPTVFTGVRFRNGGDPILNVSSPAGIDRKLQRQSLDLVESLNNERLAVEGDPEIATRIASYEMAFRLQASAPELTDLSTETKETLDLYGCDPARPSFARACLLARRMIERGVRFVNITKKGWDAHSDVRSRSRSNCGATTRPQQLSCSI